MTHEKHIHMANPNRNVPSSIKFLNLDLVTELALLMFSEPFTAEFSGHVTNSSSTG